MAALGCLLATVGLVATLIALYTVHMGIPRALECPPVGPPDDPGPGLPGPTQLRCRSGRGGAGAVIRGKVGRCGRLPCRASGASALIQ